MTSVAIYDDHVLARTGLAALLVSTSIEVRDAGPLGAGWTAGVGAPAGADVVLVSASERGVELAHRLSSEQGAAVLLVVDSPTDTFALLESLAAGAAGAVCRSCPSERVIAAIETVAAGGRISECSHAHPVEAAAPEAVLSLRERRVAMELARGLQTEEIAELLCISPHTVRTHVRNIKRKLGARTSAQAVALAITAQAVSPTALS
jgi:two-component system invasion response regulator UvrY